MSVLPPAAGGRRGNGLAAAEWGALVDVDPRLSEALLDRLAEAAVAAYVEPASGTDPVGRSVQLPKRPLDRLWVDPLRADRAREVVAAEVADLTTLLGEQTPGATAHGLVSAVPQGETGRVLRPPTLPLAATPPPVGPPPDPDAAFREIVAGWDDDAGDPVPRWPVSEDVSITTPPPALPPAPAADLGRAGLPAWLEPAALDDDGHFVPPPPPPPPRLKPRTIGAWLCIVLGLLMMFAPDLLRLPAGAGVGLLGISLLVGGAGALVWWMRDGPPRDAGPDNGAVV